MSTYNLRRSVRSNRTPLTNVKNIHRKATPISKSKEVLNENDQNISINELEKLSISSNHVVCIPCTGQDQYAIILQDAFKEVLNQNDTLRKRVIELEATLSKFEDDIIEKDEEIFKLQKKLKKLRAKNQVS